jgi:hypothetical protein
MVPFQMDLMYFISAQTQERLAQIYGVSKSAVKHIQRGRSWTHI